MLKSKTMVAILVVLMLLISTFAGCGQKEKSDPSTGTKTPEGTKTGDSKQPSQSSSKYKEAPALAKLVQGGTLPPVEERLPEDPRVIESIDSIGQYGGQLRLFSLEDYGGWNLINTRRERPFKLSQDLKTIIPNAVAGGEFNKDMTEYTLYLRKGMKWSDGHPLTSKDFTFWYECLFDEELYPSFPDWLRVQEKPAELEAIDEYTLKFKFAGPFPTFEMRLVREDIGRPGSGIAMPAHFMKKFHPKYAEQKDIDALLKEYQYENWYDLFLACSDDDMSPYIPVPTLKAWYVTEHTHEYLILERNPYYWKVDTEGNQLPYIDSIKVLMKLDPEVHALKLAAGEADFSLMLNRLQDYPMLKENEEKGNYKVRLWQKLDCSISGIRVNHTIEDPIKRQLFNDVRFKQALSYAINRDEINQMYYMGVATPVQATVLPQSPYFEPEFRTAYIEYDVDKANQLLDDIGLTARGKDGYRLGPDGKELFIVFNPDGDLRERLPELSVLLSKYWQEVGLNIQTRIVDGSLLLERRTNNQLEIYCREFNRGSEILFTLDPRWFVPLSGQSAFGHLWYRWYNTNGKEGEEPPAVMLENIKNMRVMWETTDQNKRIEAGKSILRTQMENLWVIGLVGDEPQPMLCHNRLKNVPEEGYDGYDSFWQDLYEPQHWYISE